MGSGSDGVCKVYCVGRRTRLILNSFCWMMFWLTRFWWNFFRVSKF